MVSKKINQKKQQSLRLKKQCVKLPQPNYGSANSKIVGRALAELFGHALHHG